jgi:predicted ester cyclase
MSEQRDAIDRAVAAANRGDFDGYMALYDASVVLHGYGPEPIGYDGAKEFYGTLLGALTDPHLTIDDALQEGDNVAVRFTLSGTQTGELVGVPATGRSIVLTGQSIFRFSGSKVVERWQAADMLGLLVQLGVVPAPV